MIEHVQCKLTREQELEVLREDLATYRQIENWGVTLLITAIALLSKEIHDSIEPSLSDLIASRFFGVAHEKPSDAVLSSPLLAGLVGSLFLLHINWRSRRIRARIYDMSLKPRAFLGWFFGVIPFVVSIASSFFYVGVTWKNYWGRSWLILGVAILIYHAARDICLWTNNRDKRRPHQSNEDDNAEQTPASGGV